MNIQDILNVLNIKKEANFNINKIETDSKKIEENDVFIAINKGHNYIIEAIENGAKAVITEDKKVYDCLTINVDSTIVALGKIATYIRSLYKIPLILITGSCGKTTTKELLSDILSCKYNVLKSEKNKNNHIGLPLTLLNLNNTYDVVVTELGMNSKGEIQYLSNICKPDYGVITNIGTAHIGKLNGIRNIYKCKMEILSGMNNGYLIVNKNDRFLRKVKYKNTIKVDESSLNVKNIKYCFDKTEFDIDDVHFVFHIPGKSLLNDALLAIKIGLIFDIPLLEIKDIIFNFKNMDGRLNIINKDYTIIDDSYNSSYEALINSLSILIHDDRHKTIVIGDMLEFGKYSKKYHKKVNKYLRKIKNKDVLLIGEYTKYIKGKHFKNIDEINNYLSNIIKKDCILYIKGSRAMHLDKIKTP